MSKLSLSGCRRRAILAVLGMLAVASAAPVDAVAAKRSDAARAVKRELRREYLRGTIYVECRALTARRFKCGWTVVRRPSVVFGGSDRAAKFSRGWDVTYFELCDSYAGDSPLDCFSYSD